MTKTISIIGAGIAGLAAGWVLPPHLSPFAELVILGGIMCAVYAGIMLGFFHADRLVLDVVKAIRANFVIGKAWMADEFLEQNDLKTQDAFRAALEGIPLEFDPHVQLKKRVPSAIGLIRTGDTIQYANMILESA